MAALDCREKETACHSQRVATYSIRIAIGLGLEHIELEDLYRGALLHDIGKGFGGNHSERGVDLARPCLERLRVTGERAERIEVGSQRLQAAAENEIVWSTSGYASGLYLCRLKATGEDGSKSEVVVRLAVSR